MKKLIFIILFLLGCSPERLLQMAVGALGIIGTFASIIFDDMRDAVRELHKDVKEMSGAVIRVEERQIVTEKRVDRLETTKDGK